MKRFGKSFMKGTRVKIHGVKGWFYLNWVNDSRYLIGVFGFSKSFKRSDICNYSNFEYGAHIHCLKSVIGYEELDF